MRNLSTIITILLIILVLGVLAYYVINMEEPDYIELVNNITPEEMEDINSVRLEAFNYAVNCTETNVSMQFEDIRWAIYPNREIRFSEESRRIDLAGWYDMVNDVIWVAYPYRKTRWVNSHEVLHKLGYIGHGQVFENCRLLAEQQP